MPTLTELRRRFGSDHESTAHSSGSDDALIADSRARLTPADVVEQKLRGLLRKRSVRQRDQRGLYTAADRLG